MGIVEAIETATGGHVTDWAQRRVHITVTPTRDALTNLHGQIMIRAESNKMQHALLMLHQNELS